LRHTFSYILCYYEKYGYNEIKPIIKTHNNNTIRYGNINVQNWLEVDKIFEKKFKICLHKLGYVNENKLLYEEMLKLINETLTKLTELNNQIVRKLEDV